MNKLGVNSIKTNKSKIPSEDLFVKTTITTSANIINLKQIKTAEIGFHEHKNLNRNTTLRR